MSKSRPAREAYLSSQDIKVAATSLELVSTVTGFDIVELWISYDTAVDTTNCPDSTALPEMNLVYVSVTKETLEKYPSIITGAHPDREQRLHTISPQLCQRLLKSGKRNYHWRSVHSKGGQSKSLYVEHDVPFQTEMAFRLDGVNKGINLFVVGLAFSELRCKSSYFNFLAGLIYAVYVAAFDHETETEVTRIADVKTPPAAERSSELDLKTFSPSQQLIMTPVSSSTNISGMNKYSNHHTNTESNVSAERPVDPARLNIDLRDGMIRWNRSVTNIQENSRCHEQSNSRAARTSDDYYDVGLCIDDNGDDNDNNGTDGNGIGGGRSAQQQTATATTTAPRSYLGAAAAVTTLGSTASTTAADGSFDSYMAPPIPEEVELFIDEPTEELKHDPDSQQGADNRPAPLPAYPIPHWEPQTDYAFAVAGMPVKQPVQCDLQFPHSFTEVAHLSDGSNSNIYAARWNAQRVIIKIIKADVEKNRTALHEYDMEFGILARIEHPNIIRLLGAGVVPRRFLVLEHLSGGTLTTVLAQQQKKSTFTSMIFRKPTFTYEELLLKARDMAEALDYLHFSCHPGATILHRDLKPENVGFSADGQLKLFDFGLTTLIKSRTYSSQSYKMSGYTGSLRYMAPEVALRRKYGEKVDVYSFGILLWQMARDRVPFNSISTVEDFMSEVVRGGARPKLDKSWPTAFSALLCSCWHRESELRPSFAMVTAELSKLLQDHRMGKSGSTNSKNGSLEHNAAASSAAANAISNAATPASVVRVPSAKRGKIIMKDKKGSDTQSTWF